MQISANGVTLQNKFWGQSYTMLKTGFLNLILEVQGDLKVQGGPWVINIESRKH